MVADQVYSDRAHINLCLNYDLIFKFDLKVASLQKPYPVCSITWEVK